MQKIYLVVISMIFILSCGVPKELNYPNEKLSYNNSIVVYDGKPYTGKINLSDKEGIEGFINLKDGHLEGETKLKSKKTGDYMFNFTIKNGKLDGDTNFEKTGEEQHDKFKNGVLKYHNRNIEKTATKYDLTFDGNGKATGSIQVEGQSHYIKNGVGKDPDGFEIKVYINDNDMVVYEAFVEKGESYGIVTIKSYIDRKIMEEEVFNHWIFVKK